MEIRNLMIGDWVCLDGDYELDCPMQIQAAFDNGDVMLDNDIIDKVLPIPLTKKILEKNGFERGQNISDIEPFDLDEEGNAYYQVGEFGSQTPHLWGWYKDGCLTLPNDCTMYIKIHFVHELQHALRLCGLNEMANNFIV